MKTRTTALVLVTAALSIACAAATGPESLPQQAQFSRISSAHVDLGELRSSAELVSVLPRSLAKHGYFILETQDRSSNGLQFITDWRVRPVFSEEVFTGVQQARTRLVIDAKRRGTRYALTMYAESFLEDENGSWRKAAPTRKMQEHLQQVSTAMTMDLR